MLTVSKVKTENGGVKIWGKNVKWRQIYNFTGSCLVERVINVLNYTSYLCNPKGGTL